MTFLPQKARSYRRRNRKSIPLAALAATLLLGPAVAQQHHAAGHPEYLGWYNKIGVNCCHDRDCGEIDDVDVRSAGASLEVRIEGQWCPVLANHYLKTGKSPNWATNHVCVVPDSPTLSDRSPCARLLCFQPKPGG